MTYLPPPFPDTPPPPGTWTLATYNVQDLFDTSDDPYAQDERPAENELRNKLVRLSRVLHILDADIVALMEVETRGVLQRLNTEFLSDLSYRAAILVEGNDPERGIDVALLSRFPVAQTVSHAHELLPGADNPPRRLFSRDCLECHISLPSGETLALLVNHFKSKRGGTDETAPLRLAQAVRVRAIAETLRRIFPLTAVAGDLNDTPQSAPLQILRAGGTLTDVAEDVPPALRYTFIHAGETERIDYILASPALAARLVRGSVFIPHDAWAARASDHAPLRASFGSQPPLAANLTAAYAEKSSLVRRERTAARINASRFFAHDLNPLAGQTVVVTGPVRRVEETRGTGVLRVFLGHGDPARAFRVVIFPQVRAAFGDVSAWTGQMAQAVGTLHFYAGHAEVAVQMAHQFRRVG